MSIFKKPKHSVIYICPKKYGFSAQWIQYCNDHDIEYRLVDIETNNAFDEIQSCNAFLWDYNHEDYSASLIDKQLISIFNKKNIITFPSVNDVIYFDDKISQTYLLKQHDIQHPETFVSFSKSDSLTYIEDAKFPMVFKLRKGAGGINVFKVNDKKEAIKFANQSFNKGFLVYDNKLFFRDRIQKIKNGQKNKKKIFHVLLKSVFPRSRQKEFPREKGYVFFQNFIENDGFDYRVVVINQSKAYCAKRLARPKDFRASGSGIAEYPNDKMPAEYITESFNISKKLDSLCIAIDFIKSRKDGKIYTIEISHYYDPKSMKPCEGYWTEDLTWIKDPYDPQYHLMGAIVNKIRK